jgi:hypothetical protein
MPENRWKNSHAEIEKESKNIKASANIRLEASVNAGFHRRGRKPVSQSRATEIRARLMVWKQTPEASRSSLRALAAEMGTSHQLLSFYLRRWDKWQMKEYQRKSQEICACADVENRTMTQQEQAKVVAYGRAALDSLIDSTVRDTLTTLRKAARRGKLSRQELRMAKLLAGRGYKREIQEILAASG